VSAGAGAPRLSRATACGGAAALAWLLLGLRWFDAGQPWRPAWLQATPALLLAAVFLSAFGAWAWLRRAALFGPAGDPRPPLLMTALAFAFRLPLAMQGGAGYVTPDGALSGIVALRAFTGAEHLVFVPGVAYSGSLKSHLAAALMPLLDAPRAFALASVLFYAAFVAAVFALARAVADDDDRWTPVAAALYLAFAPAFVTRYSLSNDGNYVEVLAFGTWALVAGLRWRRHPVAAAPLALAIGLLLGLAFWCHVLAVVPALALGLWMLAVAPARALRALPALGCGFLLGAWPSLLWNAGHGFETLRYLLPGEGIDPGRLSLVARVAAVLFDHWPVLLGYDPGHPRAIDLLLHVASGLALVALAAAVAAAARARRSDTSLLLVLLGVNFLLAAFTLRVIPGNPRYILFSLAAVPILLARLLRGPRGRWAMAALVIFGLASAGSQVPGALRADRQWRTFVDGLRQAGVRHCHTDFYLAAKVNFLSGEGVICSAKLGPTTTEYFAEYRTLAEQAPEAALIAVNATAAEKLERRLARAGVGYERIDLMKPVLLHFTRPVDPSLLFPDRDFPLR
jgi:hypothetical protein